MYKHIQNFSVKNTEITIKTGGFAMHSPGAVLLQIGGTVLLATATVAKEDADLDYFPLGVDYIEKMYARGAIAGGRFAKREGRPSDEAVIKAREVDHSIRSLFPKSWKKPVSVVLTVLAYDEINNPQSLTVLGASLALMQSGVPFHGPCASVIIGLDKNGEFIVNPTIMQEEDLEAHFVVSGVDNRLLSLEGWGKEIPEAKMNELLDIANEYIVDVNSQQTKFIELVGKSLDIDASQYNNSPVSDLIIDFVKNNAYDQIKNALFGEYDSRDTLISEVNTNVKALIASSDNEDLKSEMKNVSEATNYVARSILRDSIMKEERRISGRGLSQIRELKAELDILPIVHGSAMFSRGLTQSLSIATLGSKSDKLFIDDMEGEDDKSFMHHYNFPNFSTGEASRYNYYAGRREVGHGAIGENALKNMVPDQKEFPYTIRVVSEILSSNGSTSMAATCAASLALMTAGVPLKSAVAGIGVGLVTENPDAANYKLLLDIEGIEDFYGDMDFKVCGTRNGITAIQYENKLRGVPYSIIKEAFELAKNGRYEVLDVMDSVISESRSELPSNAPKVKSLQIEKEQIGELIGPGGKHIQALIAKAAEVDKRKYDPEISIEDDGTIVVSSISAAQIEFISEYIKEMFTAPEIGTVYTGVIDKVVDFGAFVNVSPKITGLIHKSNISDQFVENPSTVLQEGKKVRVKLTGIERGKMSFSMKGVDQTI